MVYSLIAYFIFILPHSIQKYSIDGRKWLLIKIINSINSASIFWLFSGNLRRLIFENKENDHFYFSDLSVLLNFCLAMLYGLFSVLAIVAAIQLALRKVAGRTLLLNIIPLLWLFTTMDTYLVSVNVANKSPSLLFFAASAILNFIFWLVFYLIYRSKRVKDFLGGR
jgi:hypothetical protein